jgi:Uma2 family endonuclease
MELSLDLTKRYSFADYLSWADNIRRELFDGYVHEMAAPTWQHQDANAQLITELSLLIRRHRGNCKVFPAPFDVRLPVNGETEDGKIYTTVQPDISVLCDLSKLKGTGCVGAPDLVVEIHSPSTSYYDMNKKYCLYERHGVREYWVVYPMDHVISVFTLGADGKYGEGVEYKSGAVPIGIFGGVSIELGSIFTFPPAT